MENIRPSRWRHNHLHMFAHTRDVLVLKLMLKEHWQWARLSDRDKTWLFASLPRSACKPDSFSSSAFRSYLLKAWKIHWAGLRELFFQIHCAQVMQWFGLHKCLRTNLEEKYGNIRMEVCEASRLVHVACCQVCWRNILSFDTDLKMCVAC